LLCRSEKLQRVLSLRPLPIATPDLRVPGDMRGSEDAHSAVPLDLNLCMECGQLQVSHVPDAEFQYRNYAYKTSLSAGLLKYYEAYAADLMQRYTPPASGFVVEAGSNDGTLLRFFKDAGMRVLGVDPATAIARDATSRGIETLPEFFSNTLAKSIRAERGPANVVIANFCTANIEDMVDFAEGVRTLLADDGIASFETQYGADVIEHNLLDTVYHEHLSYYMLTPLVRHYGRHGLEVIDVKRVPTKGGSIRLFVQPVGGPRKVAASVGEMMDEEAKKHALSPEFFSALPGWIEQIRNELAEIVKAEHAAGRSVAGWGVSVGTSALLPQFDLSDKIEFLVDDDPNKEPVLTGPGYSIPVVSTAEFYRRNPGAVIVFAWRYIKPIMDKHQSYIDGGGKFVIPLPHVSLVNREHPVPPNTIGL
jgi:hypothetical protein